MNKSIIIISIISTILLTACTAPQEVPSTNVVIDSIKKDTIVAKTDSVQVIVKDSIKK